MTDDMHLLREYVTRKSNTAFEELRLAPRELGLFGGAAPSPRRDSGGGGRTKQLILLARKAASIRPKTMLAGWLYRTTRFAAAEALRTERRRRVREHEAYMQSTLMNSRGEGDWQQLSPFLDEALARLGRAEP